MKAATDWRRRDSGKLLVIESRRGHLHDREVCELADLLGPGDLLVLNDAATLPASLPASTAGQPIEIRLAGPERAGRFAAVLLGAGDWRTPTELRPPPPAIAAGARLSIGPDFTAEVIALSPTSPRLVDIAFDKTGAQLLRALYRYGRVVQYAHHHSDLDLWSVQTSFAARPWAVEMPSAGRPLSWRVLSDLRHRGVELAFLTHAAGLSSTGDTAIDGALPLPEAYDLPRATARAVRGAVRAGRRVIAVGTTVVRSLESWARAGYRVGPGLARLVITPSTPLLVASGILTGMHEPGESHYRLLGAFCPLHILDRAVAHASGLGYRSHELGDTCLIVPTLRAATSRGASPRPRAAAL